ncbi:hypothetical protein BDN67DRAFT_971281 [Paxillus ammoniavirescens]|nr:hypothetical protein BDN67DRAFT_971281 [Paxillus ammoniavirescens]
MLTINLTKVLFLNHGNSLYDIDQYHERQLWLAGPLFLVQFTSVTGMYCVFLLVLDGFPPSTSSGSLFRWSPDLSTYEHDASPFH